MSTAIHNHVCKCIGVQVFVCVCVCVFVHVQQCSQGVVTTIPTLLTWILYQLYKKWWTGAKLKINGDFCMALVKLYTVG